LPHFSWQIAGNYDFASLEAALKDLASEIQPFTVHTAGLGLFTGSRPVVYIPVVKDRKLLSIHERIWNTAYKFSQEASPYYDPTFWMPHISLAYEDITPQNIGPLMETLAFRSSTWKMTIDNIALIFEPDGEIGALKFKHRFTGGA
jgi:2'-5' RNA ligase